MHVRERRIEMKLRFVVTTIVLASCVCVGCGRKNPYPQHIIDRFMINCTMRESTDVCDCAIGEYQDNFTVGEYTSILHAKACQEVLDRHQKLNPIQRCVVREK
jgi:hypothetical protein